MAGETLSFEILARDNASRAFKSVGDSALKTSGEVDVAAASLKLYGEVSKNTAQNMASALRSQDGTSRKLTASLNTLNSAYKTHTNASNLAADAERVLAGEETKHVRLQADLAREMDKGAGSASRFAREAENAAGSAEGLGSSLGGLGEYAMPALIGAGVALSPVILSLGFGLGGLGAAAAGVVSPILKASQASGGLQANLSKLDPLQRQAAAGLLALQNEYKGFQASLKPVILSDFNAGLRLAGNLMHEVQPVANATGKALGQVLGQVGAEFKSGTWQNFFGFMAREAGPSLRLLGDDLTGLLQILPSVAVFLTPVAAALLGITTAAIDAGRALADLAGGAAGLATGNFDQVISSMSDLSHLNRDMKSQVSDLNSIIAAAGATSKTAGDSFKSMGNHVATAATQVNSLNTGLETLLGNLVGSSTAVDSTDAAWQSLGKALKTSSLGSLAGRQAYDSYVSAVASGLSTLEKNHASFHQLNGYLATNIARLRSLGPLNATQRRELNALIQRQDQLAQSTQTLTGRQRSMLTQIEAGFLPDLRKLNVLTPQVRTDVDRFGTAIVNTGTRSDATRGARAKLIKDLENAGVSAKTAHTFVKNLQGAISALHGKNVNVGLTTSGHGKIIITGTGIATHVINTSTGQVSASGGHTVAPGGAAGMFVRSGTTPTADDVLARVSKGELVVPAKMVSAGAVDHLRGKIPGFAAGALVGGAVRAENAMASADVRVGSAAAVALAQAAAKAAQAAAAAAAAVSSGALGAGPAANAALARRMMPAWATGANWAAWNYVAMRESGWNRFARNPTSGAYGIPQALPPTKLPFAGQAAGGSHAGPQISWMIGYMRGRYGGPIGAAAHERAFGWYDRGGFLPPGLSLAYNGTGRPEPVIPAGRAGGMTVNVTVNVPPSVNPRQAGQEIAEVLKAHLRGGGSLYPAGMTPR